MDSSNLWLGGSAPDTTAAVRCFCFPYSGASAAVYGRWGASFPRDVEVCPVELPGRGRRIVEPLFSELPALVASAAKGLLPYLDRPFALFGHSLGALVAFELTRHLRASGGPLPLHLFVSGHSAPQIPDDRPPTYDLPEDAFVEKLREFGGTPEEVLAHRELMELLLPMLRADFCMSETYVYHPEEPLPCPVTALGGVGDAYVSRADLEAWSAQTNSDFAVSMFPGDHFYMSASERELVQVVAGKLVRHLGDSGS